ncbi:MAG: hypothetical protein LH610_07745 [Sphingomonas bacterium]|nr:hypothetical protein [Sphingomonas bacterium]
MYSQQDLDEAVAAGAIDATAATALRNFFDGDRMTPAVDEEQFRLVTGFNDIFVSIASVILLFAVAWIGQAIGQAAGLVVMSPGDSAGPSPLAAAALAATAWGLALFFTAKRHMALPSIILLLAFVGGVFATAALSIMVAVGSATFNNNSLASSLVAAAAALVAAGAAYLHWRRFHVPITVAAGSAAIVGLLLALVAAASGDRVEAMRTIILTATLLLGIVVFLFAMRWDSSDPARTTRRSDVAFWLHLLAAPMIVHPVFTLLGLNDGSATIGEGLVVVLLYGGLAVAALAIDRRALLVSALAYVLYALTELFKQIGAVELSVALTALVIGSALLLLSAYWHQARRVIVARLPHALQGKLPLLDRPLIPQPAA